MTVDITILEQDIVVITTDDDTVRVTTSFVGSNQAALEFQDEGTTLGTVGTVDKVNFIGSGVQATRSGNTVNVTVSSGGASAFTDLTDTPSSYSGQTLKAVRVNAGETALEFYTPSTTGLTDGNGTTANGSAVDLGGILSLSTNITDVTGANSFGITIGQSPTTSAASLGMSSGNINLQVFNSAGTEVQSFSINQSGGTTFEDTRGTPRGIEYLASGYVTQTHSLTDKEYADAHLIGATLPSAPGAGQNAQSLRWNNGGSTWEYFTPGGSGATTALDNLASVAINTSLISDTDVTDDLGSSSKYWKDIYSNTALLKKTTNQLILGTTNTATINAAAPSSSRTYTIPDAGGNDSFQFIAAAQSVTNKTFGPSTTSFPNFKLDPSGAALLTSAVAGAVEVDSAGISYYTHATSERGVNDSEQFIALTGSYTTANQTAAQQLFDATTNGQVTVASSKSYFFECFFTLSSMSNSSGSFSFALAGTATFTSLAYNSLVLKSNAIGTATNGLISFQTSASATVISNSNTSTSGIAKITGIIRVNAGGTIIPQFALSQAAAAVVGANSYFRMWPVGTNSVTNVGNWT